MGDRKKKRDINEVAFDVVRRATDPDAPAPGESDSQSDDGKDPAAVDLGRRGGKKGGPATARSMTPEQRREAARKAARIRWDRDRA